MKVIICGASGRMGKELVKAAQEDPYFQLVGGVVKSENLVGSDLGALAYDDLNKVIEECDSVIDFSMPSASVNFASIAKEHGKLYISGVTGYTDHQMDIIKQQGASIPVFHSGNMSLGINVLIKLARMAAHLMPGCDVDLIDLHHNKKIDAPSGTAKMIVSAVEESSTGNKVQVASIRAGDFFGEHQIRFSGGLESLTITHQAHSRSIFAHGALKVCKWLVDQRPGFYTMDDMLM